jgi:Ca-activated chloride channel family protein
VNRRAVLVTGLAIAASCARTRPSPVEQPRQQAAAPATAVGSDVILALDMSKSMMETDVPPNRLEAAKLALRSFVAGDKLDRIGVVVFSRTTQRLAGLDTSSEELAQTIARLQLGDLAESGTGLGDGLAAALDELGASDRKRRIVILISDGDYNWMTRATPDQAADAAKAAGVVVHTVLLGREGTSTTNASLMERIAVTTNGTLYRARDEVALERALDDIKTKLSQ